MAVIYTKPGVRFARITPELLTILRALERCALHPAVPAEGIYVTSGSDGTHAPNSKHYSGQAVDVRSKTFTRAGKREWMAVLAQELGPRYTVLLEYEGQPREHFHVQVAKGA